MEQELVFLHYCMDYFNTWNFLLAQVKPHLKHPQRNPHPTTRTKCKTSPTSSTPSPPPSPKSNPSQPPSRRLHKSTILESARAVPKYPSNSPKRSKKPERPIISTVPTASNLSKRGIMSNSFRPVCPMWSRMFFKIRTRAGIRSRWCRKVIRIIRLWILVRWRMVWRLLGDWIIWWEWWGLSANISPRLEVLAYLVLVVLVTRKVMTIWWCLESLCFDSLFLKTGTWYVYAVQYKSIYLCIMQQRCSTCSTELLYM